MRNEDFFENIALRLSPKVLQHISSNIYRQPASAFKELASNAFDASATNFEIKFKIKFEETRYGKKPILDSIEVKDNGEGISLADFQSIFTKIGDSRKARELDYDSMDAINKNMSQRPIIGRIGIGLFSIVSASDQFDIESKKKDGECYVARVKLPDFARLNVTNIDLETFETGQADIYKEEKGTEEDSSYTKISLKNFKKPFMEDIMINFEKSIIYSMANEKLENNNSLSQENDFEEYLEKILNDKEEIDSLEGKIDKFIFNLAVQMPIEYLKDGPFKKCVEIRGAYDDNNPKKILEEIKEKLKSYNFNVFFTLEFLDNNSKFYKIKLFKPISFPIKRDIDKFGLDILKPTAFLYKKTDKIKNEIGDTIDIEISMYTYKQGRRIIPYELRGILFRVYDVAIGTYDYEKLRPYNTSALQFQTSYEIFMNKGFQSCVNVDRESLYEASYSYRYLKGYFNYILGKMDRTETEYNDNHYNYEESDASNKSGMTDKDSNINETEEIDSPEKLEESFSRKLKKEFGIPNPKPLLQELNVIKMQASIVKTIKEIEKKTNHPILGIIREKYDIKLDTVDQIEIEESKDGERVVRTGDDILVQTRFLPNKSAKLPFLDVVLLALFKLDSENRTEFLSSLEKLYKFYTDKE